MQQLKRHIAKARHRLALQTFLESVAWCWLVTLVAAAIAIAVQKVFLTGIDGWRWVASWLAGSLAAGLAAALAWTWAHARSDLAAALEIDRRFGLKERISSAMALTSVEIASPCGRALADDAIDRLKRLSIAEHFSIAVPRRSVLLVVPVALIFALCLVADPAASSPTLAPTITAPNAAKPISEAILPLEAKSEEHRKEADRQGLQKAAALLKQLEDATHELAKKSDADSHQVLAKLNDIAEDLENRQAELGDIDRLKQELSPLKNLAPGPAEKLAKELASGNFESALKELAKLQEQLSSGNLSPEQLQQLTAQIDSLKASLEKLAQANQKTVDAIKKELAQATVTDNKEAIARLERELAKLDPHSTNIDALKKLARALGTCSNCMKQGNMGEAQTCLNDMATELALCDARAKEVEALTAALNDIADAKLAMCNKPGEGSGGKQSQTSIPGGQQAGDQQGGAGARPAPIDAKTYDAQLHQDPDQSGKVVAGFVDGPNAKGQAVEEIKIQMDAARQDVADPLAGQKLPRSQRDQVQQYFDALRGGK